MRRVLDLSIIIVSFNTKELVLAIIAAIKKHTKDITFEIIVVDNASTDGSIEEIKNQSGKIKNLVGIFNKENLGFAAGNNMGIRRASGRYVLVLNSDTIISNNLLKEMVLWMDKNPEVGIATCSLRNKDGSIQGTGGYFPTLPRVFSWMTVQDLPFVDRFIKPFHPARSKSFRKETVFYKKPRELDWVTGAFMLIRRNVFEKTGFFDEDYFMYVEDVDFCYRAKKQGWKIWHLPQWSIIHYGGASGNTRLSVLLEFEGLKKFYEKHYPNWQYPILRILLKIGSFGRMILFGILEGPESAKIYARAFREI